MRVCVCVWGGGGHQILVCSSLFMQIQEDQVSLLKKRARLGGGGGGAVFHSVLQCSLCYSTEENDIIIPPFTFLGGGKGGVRG